MTIWTPSQFLAYEDDPQDIVLSNGYLGKGSPCVLCGPPGIGKSRIILQMAIKSVLGQEFLGWDTNASGLKWLIFQNENGNKRIKSDYLLSNAVFGVTCTEARSTDIVSCFQGEPRKKTL